jgi:hypothetical protein
MSINKSRVISELQLRGFGSKGWMHSEKTSCPHCGKWDKFGIIFNDKGGSTNCFYGCTPNLSLYKYLIHLKLPHLIDGVREYIKQPKLTPLIKENAIKNHELEEKKLPSGFKRVYYDEYLDERGWTPEQYNLFQVGVSKDPRLKDYLVFIINQKGKVVAWLARSKRSKEWHKQNLKDYKEERSPLYLRYRNSEKTDFENILGGFDEITNNTHTVWLVEGIMDKISLDRLYNLYGGEEIKCCFTFGNKLSDFQLNLLSETKVKNIIMLYDFGTTKAVKQYGAKLTRKFNVFVGEFRDEEIDAGDATKDYMDNIFKNIKEYFYFYKNRL